MDTQSDNDSQSAFTNSRGVLTPRVRRLGVKRLLKHYEEHVLPVVNSEIRKVHQLESLTSEARKEFDEALRFERAAKAFATDLRMLPQEKKLEVHRGKHGAYVPLNKADFANERMNAVLSGKKVQARTELVRKTIERRVIPQNLLRAEELLLYQEGKLAQEASKTISPVDAQKFESDEYALGDAIERAVQDVYEASEFERDLRGKDGAVIQVQAREEGRRLVSTLEPEKYRKKEPEQEVPQDLAIMQ